LDDSTDPSGCARTQALRLKRELCPAKLQLGSYNRGNIQIAQRTHIIDNMKLKVKIAGPKVHDVGYRVFLLRHAMNLALPGLSTYNWEEDGQQEVIALVQGDEARIKAFLHTVEKNKPEPAEVSKVTFEDYDGDVGRTSEVAMLCSFVQLDKAIPLLLDMRDDLKEMKGDIKAVRKTTGATLDEIKGLREDIQPGYATQFRQVQADVRAIKDRLGLS